MIPLWKGLSLGLYSTAQIPHCVEYWFLLIKLAWPTRTFNVWEIPSSYVHKSIVGCTLMLHRSCTGTLVEFFRQWLIAHLVECFFLEEFTKIPFDIDWLFIELLNNKSDGLLPPGGFSSLSKRFPITHSAIYILHP